MDNVGNYTKITANTKCPSFVRHRSKYFIYMYM